MKFTLHISTDSKRKDIKERCCEVLAEFLKKEGYFSVEFLEELGLKAQKGE